MSVAICISIKNSLKGGMLPELGTVTLFKKVILLSMLLNKIQKNTVQSKP